MEVLSWRGLVTYYVLFFLHLESRRVPIAGITRHPGQEWMERIGHSATQESWGYLHPCRYVLHDRDTKFCASFWSASQRRCENDSSAGQEPKPECIRGTLFSDVTTKRRSSNYSIQCRQRLGGLLKYYSHAA